MAKGPQRPRTRTLLYPLAILGSTAVLVFLVFYSLDYFLFGIKQGFVKTLLSFDVDTLQNALGNMAQVVAAVLGIVITVVSIVVQLAATRYTPRVADLFFRDRTNLGVLAFFVVACINAVWVSISVERAFVPKISIIFTIALVTASLLLMVPYFAYVFESLDPDHVVGRIQEQTLAHAVSLTGGKSAAERQMAALQGVEQLADIAINAVSQKDKAIASGACDSLKDLATTYLQKKSTLPDERFVLGPRLLHNPDFVSLAQWSIEELGERKLWLEWKVLRAYQSIYHEALSGMPDINHLLAINSRYVGEAALDAHDENALGLVVKFFNTFMRATLNAEEVRTAYNVLNQYRELGEHALERGHDALVTQIAGYLRYYGQLAHGMQLSFVTETTAYDLALLCERAFALGAPAHDAVLSTLLELDKEAETKAQESMLRGVRKAQAKLASFYLMQGAAGEAAARRIFSDMRDERPERLRSICDELLAVKTKDFWEVIDRGTNFDYVEPERKAQLKVFFSWFPSLRVETSTAGS